MYIIAGLHTVLDYFEKQLDQKSLEITLSKLIRNGLISYGIPLDSASKKLKENFDINEYNNKFQKLYDTCITKHKKHLHYVLDSGGYQISIGLLPEKHKFKFIEAYSQYIANNPDLFDEMFTLDLPVTKDFDLDLQSAIEANEKSLKITLDIVPEEVKKKLLFVTHFRTLSNFRVWKNLIYDKNLADGFQRFSIGGLVTGMNLIHALPVNFYTIGLLTVLLYIKDNRNKFPNQIRFHVLGASNAKSIFFFYLLKQVVLDKYGIDLLISYDSSNMFKQLIKARDYRYFDENSKTYYKISGKEKDLKAVNKDLRRRNIDIILTQLSEIAEIIGYDIDVFKYDNIYDSSGSFIEELRPLILLLEPYNLNRLDDYLQEQSQKLFDLYKKYGDTEFIHETDRLLKQLGIKQTNTSSILTSIETIYKIEKVEELESLIETFWHVTMTETEQIKADTFDFLH